MSNRARWTAADLPDQTGRRWLITGATHGLGLATARLAAAAGATLVLPARNRARAESVNSELGRRHEVVDLDLADLGKVRTAAAAIIGGIDVLVNNAGSITASRRETADGFEWMLGVNFLGPFAFTNLLAPQVRDRVVIVGSNAHTAARMNLDDPHFRRRRWRVADAYGASKLADLLWGLALERRLRGRGVGVQLTHPGWVMSNMQNTTGHPRLGRAITVATTPVAQSAEKSALTTLFAATMDLPPASYVGPDGRMHLHGWPSLIGRSAEASDPRLAERVWQFAVAETGVDLSA
ncbi:SDR family NAD(P)-dependent oxidoreductase [Ammonicoccus fulvus]|uniref:SDR family NAD(P)-dependent oxidoreductase n=1 Tax=Ammonicoccus fulvus TaxID=3138240 RepID=A0ABZ3FWU6_9ACTN